MKTNLFFYKPSSLWYLLYNLNGWSGGQIHVWLSQRHSVFLASVRGIRLIICSCGANYFHNKVTVILCSCPTLPSLYLTVMIVDSSLLTWSLPDVNISYNHGSFAKTKADTSILLFTKFLTLLGFRQFFHSCPSLFQNSLGYYIAFSSASVCDFS